MVNRKKTLQRIGQNGFAKQKNFDWLVEVDRDFIEDEINIFDVKDYIYNLDNYDEAFEMVLSKNIPKDEDVNVQ